MIRLRELLHSRADDVINSRNDTALNNLRIYFEFLDSDLQLKSIMQELSKNLPDASSLIKDFENKRRLVLPAVYIEKVKCCLSILSYWIEKDIEPWQFMVQFTSGGDVNIYTREALLEFFRPVAKYIMEKISVMDSFQYLLIRYKLQSEWFERENLLQLFAKDTTKGESVLDALLREYLFNQGVDFPFSKPSSPSGEVDVLSIVKRNPIPLEVKVFDNVGRTQAHVKQGVIQAYSYAKDYGEASAYLMVFNVSNREIVFKLNSQEIPQRVAIGDKTVYIFTVNLFSFEEPASKRKLEPALIEERYLLET